MLTPGERSAAHAPAPYNDAVTPCRRAETDPVKEYLEGAELTGVRCALFTAGDLEAVKKLVQGETGSSFRVAGKVKIRELMTFAVSEDLAALRMTVGTNVEVPARK